MSIQKKVSVEFAAVGTGRIAILYLDDPQTRNSFSLEMGMAFQRELQNLAAAETLPRALVLTGRNGVFSSGGDFDMLRGFPDKSVVENREFMYLFYRLFLTVRDMPFPVIAAVNGHAVGAGLALALACDLRYFVPDAKYAFNFVKIGLHPGLGSSFLLKEVAGLQQAQELLLTGRYFDGAEALRRGLCHGLFAREELSESCLAVAHEIAVACPEAVRACKMGLYQNGSLEKALAYEAKCQADNYASEDFKEALQAIAEKRDPVFRDR